jgi:hypothetical protein
MCSRDEVPEHCLGYLEVSDNSIAQRADSLNVARRAPEHFLGLATYCQYALVTARVPLNRNHGWFAANDALALYVNERRSCAKIDGQIT